MIPFRVALRIVKKWLDLPAYCGVDAPQESIGQVVARVETQSVQLERAYDKISTMYESGCGEPFEIGWLPRGWKRGDVITVSPANRNMRGIVQRQCSTLSWVGDAEVQSDAILFTFDHYEADNVQLWLDWFQHEVLTGE